MISPFLEEVISYMRRGAHFLAASFGWNAAPLCAYANEAPAGTRSPNNCTHSG